ncbi:MAG: hypothetical protein IRY87_03525 [Acetobacteraceae bacterium]|nr:hypothetical protein [Acetobacteraceae bacterium]
MDRTFLASILGTGFAVAFLHSALPTHWLPFVLAGRGQGWSRPKTLSVTAFAGLGHVLFTTALGVLVVWLGIETSRWTGDVFPLVAGGALIAFGLYYLVRQSRGLGGHHHWGQGDHHHHDHAHGHGHEHPHDHGHGHAAPRRGTAAALPHDTRSRRSDLAAVLSLLALLTFSPCEGFLPVYLSGIRYGWVGFAVLSAILALGTLAGMVLFTWLALAGLERLRLGVLERYESGLLGGLLSLLGVAVMLLE